MQMGSEARVEVEVRKLFYLIWHKLSYFITQNIHLEPKIIIYTNTQITSFYDSIIITAQVTKLWGDKNISTAVVHPVAAAEGCEVREKKLSRIIESDRYDTGDGRQGVLCGSQAGPLHDRHQRADGRAGADE